MKKLFLTLFATVTCHFAAQAKFILVNNNANAVEKFSTLQMAYDSAAVGDTIYLVPSPNSYAENFTIKKRINLLGAGFKDKSGNILPQFSTVRGINIDTSGNSVKTSGTVICGIRLTQYNNSLVISSSIKNVFVFNCFIDNGVILGDNCTTVFDNVFTGGVSFGKNVFFRNNVVTGGIASGTNCNITNNIFIGTSPISGFNSSSFTNNIFLTKSGADPSAATNNSYSYNIQGLGYIDLGSGNLTNQDMSTVFQESTIANTSGNDLLKLSFLLKPNSTGLTYASDGKEVGVYNGTYAWPKGVVYTRSPGALPIVTNLVVQNQTVKPGGKLLFNFKAKDLK